MHQLKTLKPAIILIICLVMASFCKAQDKTSAAAGIPQLIRQGNVTTLYVDRKPFLILGGELNNSSSSSLTYMQPLWKQAKDLNFNTLLTPLSWEQIEP